MPLKPDFDVKIASFVQHFDCKIRLFQLYLSVNHIYHTLNAWDVDLQAD